MAAWTYTSYTKNLDYQVDIQYNGQARIWSGDTRHFQFKNQQKNSTRSIAHYKKINIVTPEKWGVHPDICKSYCQFLILYLQASLPW